ncbi:hypothetical protein Q5752_000933 [Cryptotrichosporon argae]
MPALSFAHLAHLASPPRVPALPTLSDLRAHAAAASSALEVELPTVPAAYAAPKLAPKIGAAVRPHPEAGGPHHADADTRGVGIGVGVGDGDEPPAYAAVDPRKLRKQRRGWTRVQGGVPGEKPSKMTQHAGAGRSMPQVRVEDLVVEPEPETCLVSCWFWLSRRAQWCG